MPAKSKTATFAGKVGIVAFVILFVCGFALSVFIHAVEAGQAPVFKNWPVPLLQMPVQSGLLYDFNKGITIAVILGCLVLLLVATIVYVQYKDMRVDARILVVKLLRFGAAVSALGLWAVVAGSLMLLYRYRYRLGIVSRTLSG